MKYIITESKVKEVITNYLDTYAHPDYDVGFKLHDFYQDEIKTFGSYTFTIDDVEAYTYWGNYGGIKNFLEVHDDLNKDLTQKFGKMWVPIFIDWFEKNVGLKVDQIYLPKNI